MIKLLIAFIAGVALTAALAWKLRPVPETKEITRDRIVTVTKTIKQPNGTTEIDQVTTEDVQKQVTAPAVVATKLPVWGVGAGYNLDRKYYVTVDRQILGPLAINVTGVQGGTVGIGLKWSF